MNRYILKFTRYIHGPGEEREQDFEEFIQADQYHVNMGQHGPTDIRFFMNDGRVVRHYFRVPSSLDVIPL